MSTPDSPVPPPRPRSCLVALLPFCALVGLMVWMLFDITSGIPSRLDVANMTNDYRQVCAGDGISGAADYRPGHGPHPIAVFDYDRDGYGSGVGIQISFSDIDHTLWNPSRPSTVQLVACAERVDEGEQVSTCTFDGGVVAPVRRATVDITVRVARTGEQLGDPITVEGMSTDCPFMISYREHSEPEVFTGPTKQQYVEALQTFVQG
jgi:hypothetical protein